MNIVAKYSRFLIAVIFLIIILTSCNQPRTHNATDKKYAFALHLQAGQKFYIGCSNQTNTQLSTNTKEINNTNSIFVGLVYEVLKDSSTNFAIRITYDSLHSYIKNNDDEMEMDAANAANSINPVEKLLGVIKGKPIMLWLSNKGEVVSITGLKEISDLIIAASGGETEESKKKLQTQLSGMLGENFVKDNIALKPGQLPDTAIYEGDSWTRSSNEANALGLKMQTKYTLNKIENDIAAIQAQSNLHVNDTTINFMGFDASVNVKGNGDNKFTINTITGMLTTDVETITIEGKVKILGKEVPVKIKTKKEISVKKL